MDAKCALVADGVEGLTTAATTEQSDVLNPLLTSETPSSSQQQPNCDASETADALAEISNSPDLRRSSSSSSVNSSRSASFNAAVGTGSRSRSRSGGDDGNRASSELVLQLQRLCRRQRQRSEERAFVRDVERALALLRAQKSVSDDAGVTSATFPGPGMSLELLGSVQEEDGALAEKRLSAVSSNSSPFSGVSSTNPSDRLQASRVMLTLAEIDALLDCIEDLFDHRNPGVRALAFEVVQLCLLRFGERLTPALRRKIYLRLETHPPGDFLLRQKALRALTQDGRHLEPFHVELGWFLLRLLEQSDAQRDLLGLIQSILRRSPRALDRDKVIAIVSVISTRCDMAWSRSDLDACHNFVAFFYALAMHDLAYAASTPACLRSLCCLVNADGHGTWSVMKLLLNGSSGFLVLRGLVQVLEHPTGANSPWVLRGAVFFVGMSCWGSQRVTKFDDIAWAPILLALKRALQCCRGVVIFEVILSIQRLIKKFGATHPPASSGQSAVSSTTMSAKLAVHSGDSSRDTSDVGLANTPCSSGTSCTSSSRDKRCLVMEWDIILRMLQALRPWVSMTDENEIEDFPQQTLHSDARRSEVNVNRPASIHPTPDQPQHQLSVSIQQTRIPRELLDTLQTVEDLVEQRRFAGDVEEFLNILEDYLPHLSESSMLFLLRQRAEAAHPGYHLSWLSTLSSAMRTFFSCTSSDGEALPVPSTVRLEALEVLRVNLWTSRNVCEDRVIEEVVIPTLSRVYEDPDEEIRRRALGFVIEVARQLESVKFDSLLDILANAMTLSIHEDAQLVAAKGIVSLFSSAFDHLPPARAVRMYDLLATTVEAHRSRAIRHVALSCMLYVCEARATDGRLQWKGQQQTRTSRFLFVSRRAARSNATGTQLTAACVPVARAFRALLTLVSAEPDAHLFRMAVKGIKTMLENRAILEDVDVSEVSAKVVASIDYRAFGRAAIANEVDRLLDERMTEREAADGDAMAHRDRKTPVECQGVGRLVSQTDAELVRLIHASTRPNNIGRSEVSFYVSVQATAVLLAKTRFLGMGIELLQLLVSYESKLHDNALQELTRCLVGAMELPLAIAEKDLFTSGSAADDLALSSASSAPDMLYRHNATTDIADPYASGTPLGFTSRVLSRFQNSTSHGNLFHALSGTMSKSAIGSSLAASTTPRSRSTRNDRARLQSFLRQLFDSEFKLFHTTTTALSLLALLAPGSALGQLDKVFQNLRGCVTTVDGDFRSDAFVAMLELLGTIAPMLDTTQEDRVRSTRKAIVEVLLLGFECAKSKQLAYLAFRLLCQVIYQSSFKERVCLAALAMPTLQQYTHRTNSLLAEAAVDFLMCYAHSQSALTPSAFVTRQQQCGSDESEAIGMLNGSRQTRSRSWVYKRSLLTITTNLCGDASLTIRRANCTSRWKLGACDSPSSFLQLDLDAHSESDDNRASSDRLRRQRVEIIGARSAVAPKRLPLPAELRPSYPSRSRSHHKNESQALASADNKATTSSRSDRAVKDHGKAMEDEDHGEMHVDSSLQNTTFHQSAAASALPPLPAYDGIGGSPSYYCDNAQVYHQVQRKMGRPALKNKRRYSRQAEGEDRQEGLSGVIRAIQEDIEENNESESQEEEAAAAENERWESEMNAFSLDDSLGGAQSQVSETPKVSQFAESSFSGPVDVESMCESSTVFDEDLCDPKYLMMQLFDLTVENRPQLLSDGPSLELALSVLDRTPEFETHKIGLLYVKDERQCSETTVLGNIGGSLRYLRFLRRLGTFTKLEGLSGYTGGLDTVNNSDGKFGLIYKDSCAQIMFHVATMMIPESNRTDGSLAADKFASMKKKRHIGNDFVHVVFKECDEDYDLQTLSGQFNDVHIVIQPLDDHEYRTEVHVKQGIPPFGPLYGRQIVSSSIISESVRLTCLNANLACQVFHQDLVGFALNCEERLKQIKQLGLRLASTDEWKLDE